MEPVREVFSKDRLIGVAAHTRGRLRPRWWNVVGVRRHEHRRGAATTDYAGLDVSLDETAICVVDAAGTIVEAVRAESPPDALHDASRRLDLRLERVGMEACSLTASLHGGLTAAGWPAICIGPRGANAAIKTMPNETDHNDARTAPQRGADHADGPAAVS